MKTELHFDEKCEGEKQMITENKIQCPHCEHVHKDWWQYLQTEASKGSFKMECNNCDDWFVVSFSTTISFTTKKIRFSDK